MVGRRIDDILAEKANNKNVSGNCYLSPLVIPVVSSFKRLYKRRLSRNAVFKGKPLHTIEETTESSQIDSKFTSVGIDKESQDLLQENTEIEKSFDDLDFLLQEIRHLFSQEENREHVCFDDDKQNEVEEVLDGKILNRDECKDLNCFVDCESPSFSLMLQFEMAVKEEAVLVLQNWYRKVRDRRKFLRMRNSAILIQRTFRRTHMQR